MSLKLNERYPARFGNPSSDYPQGSFKNRTTPTAKDGSYLEKDWANDKEGFFQSLIFYAQTVPNGLVDKVGGSQYYDSLLKILRNNSAKYTASGSFVVPAGVTTIYISGCGGGGGGGYSSATSSNISGGGAGGGAGRSIIREPYTVTPGTTISITVGNAGGDTSNGGNTVIGALVTLAGGSAGSPGVAGVVGTASGGIGGAGYPKGEDGSDAGNVAGTGCGGNGASTPFGGGGPGSRSVYASVPPLPGGPAFSFGYGAGGGGAGGASNTGTRVGGAGGAGAGGLVIIEW